VKRYNRLFAIVLAVPALLLSAACDSGGEGGPTPSAGPSGAPSTAAQGKPTPTPGKPSVEGELHPVQPEAPPAGTPYSNPLPPAEPVTPTPPPAFGGPTGGGSADPAFVGEWRAYSEYIYYDAGGGGGTDVSASGTTRLELYEDGTWQFGSSRGYWSIEPIAAADWGRWGVPAYGPERKIALDGWNGGLEDGPVEESGGYVDFVWVIYHVDSPEPGMVYIKFGH